MITNWLARLRYAGQHRPTPVEVAPVLKPKTAYKLAV